MALTEIRDVQDGFDGGLNTTADVWALQPNEVRLATNCRLSTRGSIEKRGGTQLVSAAAISAHPVRGGFSWRTASATTELAVVNGVLYTGTLGIPMTWTSQSGSLSTTAVPSFAAFRGPSADGVYIADGGLLNFWDGATLTTNIASTPSLDVVVAWGPRLFGLSSAAPETLYWSSTTGGVNGSTIGAAAGGGQAIVRTYGGQRLTALAPLRGSLLMFHVGAISRFTGMTTDDVNIAAGTQGITSDVGTIAPRSIVVVENAAYFLSDRGAFACSETAVAPISSPIERTLADLSQTDWSKVAAVHSRKTNEIWWSIPSVGIYALNYRTGGWTGPWDGGLKTPEITALWDTRDSGGRTVILAGNADGEVQWCDRSNTWKDRVASDGTGGAAYTMSTTLRRFFAGDFVRHKSWRDLYLLGEFASTEDLSITVRNESGSTVVEAPDMDTTGLSNEWGASDMEWGASGTVWGASSPLAAERIRFPIAGVWPWIDVTVSENGNNAARIIRAVAIGFPRNRR